LEKISIHHEEVSLKQGKATQKLRATSLGRQAAAQKQG